MNKLLTLLLVAVIASGAIPYARSIGAPSPPPGIPEARWIAMGDAAGFVIAKDTKLAAWDGAKGLNSTKGFFMVRKGDRWLRVDSSADFDTVPALAISH